MVKNNNKKLNMNFTFCEYLAKAKCFQMPHFNESEVGSTLKQKWSKQLAHVNITVFYCKTIDYTPIKN